MLDLHLDKKMNDNGIVLIFIIILAVVAYLIANQYYNTTPTNPAMMPRQQGVEGFTDYQDVKTKTLNWCQKMLNAGLLTSDQFDQCVSSFKDTTAGITASGLVDSQYGLNMDYSIYNSRATKLASGITNSGGGDNTNIIMITSPSPNSKTLACRPDGSLYQVANIDDPNINQKELYFSMQPINETAYAILSPYGGFLAADNTFNATLTGKSAGPLSTWNVIKITSSTETSSNLTQVMIESTQFPGFHLVFDSTQNTLSIQQGRNDSMIWSITARASSDSSPDSKLDVNVSQYTVLKEVILAAFKNNGIIKIALQAGIETINNLKSQIENNYTDIANHVQAYMQNQQRIYQLSSIDYNTRAQSIRNNSMINPDTQNTLIANLPPTQGLNLTDDTMSQVLAAINNQKNITLQYINNNALLPLQQKLGALTARDVSLADYNQFMTNLNAALQDTNNQIAQNQKIISRQKDKYNAINADYSYQQDKITKLDKVDKVAELNVGLLSGYQSQKGYFTKIYPVCIFFLVVGLIYLSYLTYGKFINNVWSQYKD
jgi:hypothetical protein